MEDNDTSVLDVTDPKAPKYLAHIPGEEGKAEPGGAQMVRVCAGAELPQADKAKFYMLRVFGYSTNTDGVLQIVDREKLLSGPKDPTPENLLFPQVARLDLPPKHGAYTVFPMLNVDVPEFEKDLLGMKRDFIVVTDEAIQKECLEGRQLVWFVDITTETKPFGVASWTVPGASGNFCSRGGRFGTHSSNERYAPVFFKRVMFFAHFNAGQPGRETALHRSRQPQSDPHQ